MFFLSWHKVVFMAAKLLINWKIAKKTLQFFNQIKRLQAFLRDRQRFLPKVFPVSGFFITFAADKYKSNP